MNRDEPIPDRRPSSVIGPVEVPKAAEVFAGLLRERILRGDFAQGEVLPPERVLVEQSHLSRAAVREALSILKQQGLIVTRTGRNGGSVVSRPTSSDLKSSLEIFLQSQGMTEEHPTILQVREMLEPWCAALAAAHRTETDLELLRRAHDEAGDALRDTTRYVTASRAFHNALAQASHNVLLKAFIHARSDAIVSSSSSARYASLAARTASVKEHAQILSAIENREPRLAYDLMARHVRGHEPPLLELLEAVANDADPG